MMLSSEKISYTNNSDLAIELPQNSLVTLETGASVLNCYIKGGFYLERNATVNRSTLSGPSGLGAFSYIADAKVGPFVNIGARSSIGGYEHPKDWLSTSAFQWTRKPSLLGEDVPSALIEKLIERPNSPITDVQADVWIGSNVVVKAGVTLGTGSIIGAGSVVTKDTVPYGIYVGNPAALNGFRFNEEIREKLLEIRWWEFPIAFLLTLPFQDVSKCIEILQNYHS